MNADNPLRPAEAYASVMTPNYAPADFIPVRGAGSRVWTRDERSLVDFGAGIAVNSLGHCHPELVAALSAQASRLWHVSNVVTNEPALHLAAQLCAATFAERVFFCNSGAEANEAALKLARRHAATRHSPERNEILSFSNSFHGRTLFTVSVGGQPKYCQHFGPLPGGIRHLAYNDLAAVESAIGARTCAVIVEPLQGEGGVLPAAPGFLQGLRQLCDAHGALLIFDEVQTGVGRCGALYACMTPEIDVRPDILTTAKGLGGGFPVGAMLTTADIAESLVVGSHGTTFGGNPLACAVASRVLDIVDRPDFLAAVRERGRRLRTALEGIGSRYGVFEQVRGMGMLLGCVTAPDWRGRAADIVRAGHRHGVWCLVAGADVVRVAPPLVLDDEAMRDGLDALEAAVAEVTKA